MPAAWTEDRKAVLLELAKVHAASEIAAMMGTTRNAVLGKLFRLGVSLSGTASQRELDRRAAIRKKWAALRAAGLTTRSRPRRTTEPAPRYVPPPIPADAPPPRNLSILDLATGDCRWPVTPDHPMLFCGHAAVTGWSYCPFHMKQAHAEKRVPVRRDPAGTELGRG